MFMSTNKDDKHDNDNDVMSMMMIVVMMMVVLMMKGINLGLRSWLRPVTLAGEAEGGGAILSDPVCNYQL